MSMCTSLDRRVALVTMLTACLLASGARSARASAPEYGQLPLSFEVNRGQTDARVKFLSRGAGYTLFLTSREAVLSLQPLHGVRGSLRMSLSGAAYAPKVEGCDQLPGTGNYFIGNDPKKWRTGVSTFARVRYRDVYPGVDLVYYGNQRMLENDFIVAPGTKPEVIALAFAGADTIEVDAGGSLVLGLPGGDVRLQKPVVYQVVDGARREIAGTYVIKNRREVGFEVAAYDLTQPLVIDPVLVYSSYLGGNGADAGNAIAVDSAGSAYVTGTTSSSLFPTAAPIDPTLGGSSDIFVSKINAAGSALVYSTYLGGSATDLGSDIAVDGWHEVYLTGRTTSNDFPTVNAFDATYSGGTDEDAFVTRIDAAGSALLYSTYLSGTFGARGFGIATRDDRREVYVIGTTSTGFPVTTNAFEATNFNSGFLTQLCTTCSGAASLLYSTFLAHTGTLEGRSIAADGSELVWVAGNLSASATSFATAGAFQTTYGGGSSDAFIEKFNPVLSGAAGRVYATYLGGSGKDSVADSSGNSGKALAVDVFGNAYLTGATGSTNFPLSNAAQGVLGGLNDAFLTKLNAAGSALSYSTYLGGTDGWVSVVADPTIMGLVKDEYTAPMVGATVNLTGASSATTTSGPLGAYTFGLLGAGSSYTISVSAPGYIYSSVGVTNLQKNVRLDLGPSVVTISGQVTLGAGGVDNVTMILSGGAAFGLSTNVNGQYTLSPLVGGRDFTVTPQKDGFVFTPTSRTFTNVLTNVTGADFAATAVVGEASRTGNMTASKDVGTSVDLFFAPACGAIGHTIYRGTGPITSGLVWNASYCGYGTFGFINFDPGNPPPGSFWYFVVVGHLAATEGSYGKNSAGAQRPEAIGVGACDLPQNISTGCP